MEIIKAKDKKKTKKSEKKNPRGEETAVRAF